MASFRAYVQLDEAAKARQHTHMVLERAASLLSALRDAETGQRGYSLTGDTLFLEPYDAVVGTMRARVEELTAATRLEAARAHLGTISSLADAKMLELARVVALRRAGDVAGVLEVVKGGRGKQLMDALRAEVGAFTVIEEDALAVQEADFQHNMQRLFAAIVIASLVTLLLALSFARFTYRESEHRLKALVHEETRTLLNIQEATNAQLNRTNATLAVSEERLAVTLNSIGDAVIATDAAGLVTLLNPLAESLTGWTLAAATGHHVNDIFCIINEETRRPAKVPVTDALTHGTIQGLANHTVLIARDGTERSVADSCAPIRDRDSAIVGAVLVFRDVTDEYVLQRTARENAALLQTILDAVVDGIITVDAADNVETANRSACAMFGYAAADLIGHSVTDLIPSTGDAAGPFERWALGPEAGTQGIQCEAIGRRKDGTSFPMEMAVSEMWLGGQRHFTGVCRDLTQRKAAEEALLKAGALQTAIFNSANFSSIATDANGVIQIFNVGAERMLGYAAVDVVNKVTPAALSDPAELVSRANALSGELSTRITPGFEALAFKASRGMEDIYELTHVRKDGSRFPALVSVTALRDAQNTIIGFLLIGTDNTARKEIEAEQHRLDQRLRDQQFYTRSLIESNVDAIMTTDPAGVITDVNRQMEALTGCTRDELIGALCKNFFTDPARADAGIKLVLSERKVTDYELTARARDGKETVVSYNATTFYDRERRLQGVFAAARDITERKRLDLILAGKNVELEAATAAAEKASLAKSDFLSSMSHELRSPLNAILGFAQLLESDSPPPTASQLDSVGQILKAGWHLLTLINEILDLAKVESRQVPLSREPVFLAEVIGECRSIVEHQAQERGITLVFPHGGTSYVVSADRTRLKQVLINLLSNAIKYNRRKGVVELTFQEATPDRLRVSIRDTGAGLMSAELEQLFQPFNRLSQEAGAEEGTGIGLVVAKRLVELMGGSIGVTSEKGVGSVFWFELNSVAAPQLSMESGPAQDPAAVMRTHPAQVHTVLYVEDNPANLKLVEKLLAREPGIRLLTAVTGSEGIEVARAAQPHLILMDINLPGMDGFEALAHLRADPATAHIPVIAVSANAMPLDVERGINAGFLRYLTKPIRVNEFISALDAALERDAPTDAARV